MSTNPGATIRPVASRVSAASPSRPASSPFLRRTSTIRPSLTPISARYRSTPVPSTTVPPVIFRSYIGPSSDQAEGVEQGHGIRRHYFFPPVRGSLFLQPAHVPVVLPDGDLAVLHPVHGDEP